jgi:hypothetical protein
MIYLRGLAIDSGDATAIYYSGPRRFHRRGDTRQINAVW